MHFRNPVKICDFKTQTFSILYLFIRYLVTTFISFAVSVISMSDNVYLIQYHFNIIPFTHNRNIVGCSFTGNNYTGSTGPAIVSVNVFCGVFL